MLQDALAKCEFRAVCAECGRVCGPFPSPFFRVAWLARLAELSDRGILVENRFPYRAGIPVCLSEQPLLPAERVRFLALPSVCRH